MAVQAPLAAPDPPESAPGLAEGTAALQAEVSEWKRVEQELRASQQRLMLHVQQTPLGVIEWNTNFEVTEWNPRAEAIFGYRRAEAMGRHSSFIVPDAARADIDRVWQGLLSKKGGERSSNENITKDGRRIVCEWYNTPLVDASGQVIGVASLVEDITQRVRAEQARETLLASLHLSEKNFRAVVENLPQKIALKDCNSVYISCNSNYARDIKAPIEAIPGTTDYDYHPKELADKYRADDHRVIESGEVQELEESYVQDGREFVVHTVKAPVRDDLGNISGVVVIFWDITDRKRAESKLIEQAALLNLAHDAIIVRDLKHRIVYWNPGAQKTYGWTAEQANGQVTHDLLQTRFPVSLKTIEASIRRDEQWDGELAHLTSDGRSIVVASRWSLLSDAQGHPKAILEINRDITERKKSEQALERYAAELERSNAELADFASIASHDLQEPLRKVMAFGERLTEHSKHQLDAEGQDFLRRMCNAAQRMSELIDALLQYSRLSTRAQLFVSTDLGAVLRDVLSDLEARIHQSGANLDIGPLPKVWGDPTQLRQLLQNLLSNALKFHTPDQPPRVAVRGTAMDRGWEITVADQGIGFDEKYLDRIFRPFQRLHARGEYAGSGMGLSICRKIVTRHGGTITAHSRPGQGSTFVVFLPDKAEEGQRHERP